MLYDPRENEDYKSEWFFPSADGKAGLGVQIVIGVADAARIRDGVMRKNYACSDLHTPPWGTLEFTFTLKEGYLIRIKQALPAADQDFR